MTDLQKAVEQMLRNELADQMQGTPLEPFAAKVGEYLNLNSLAGLILSALSPQKPSPEELREKVAIKVCQYESDRDCLNWPEDKCREILAQISAPHSGDCTKKPWTCLRCAAEDCYRLTDALLALLPDTPCEAEWRPEVRAFADLMEQQLRANDHKPGWKDCRWKWLLSRLRGETQELETAIRDALAYDTSDRGDRGSPWTNVGREAADVANFAMMIADVCGALPAPPQSKGGA